MNALAVWDNESFELESSPTFLRYEPSIERAVVRSPAPGRDLIAQRHLARGLDVLMNLEDSAKLNHTITPAVMGRFFLALPSGLPSADAYVSAHGSVCFDWDDEPSNALSLFVQSDRRVGYSAYFNGRRSHGVADFKDTALPAIVMKLIKEWIENHKR